MGGDVLQGTVELMVLKALSLEAMHGWGIAQRLDQMSGEVFQLPHGSLYPALQRMTTHSGVWRCEAAYSMLAISVSLATLPATRTSNKSPSP